ncbi:hypothetical protein ACP70R_043698 [Stipagrostis hirtigluma subsp. patula]
MEVETETAVEGASSSARRGGDGSLQTSGTTLSTAYTSGSGSSRLPSSGSGHLVGESGRDLAPVTEPKHVQDLAFEFDAGDASVPERWLSELDVGWVLHLAVAGDDASRRWLRPLQHFARRWCRALDAITSSNCSAFSKHNGREDESFHRDVHLLSARFIEAIHLKMIPFVAAVCSVAIADDTDDDGWAVTPAEKLQALIDVARTLDTTLSIYV